MTQEKDESLASAVLAIFVLLPLSILARGWSVSVLWGWFVVPTIHLPVLSVGGGLGLSVVVWALMPSRGEKAPGKSGLEQSLIALLGNLVPLALGIVVHMIVGPNP